MYRDITYALITSENSLYYVLLSYIILPRTFQSELYNIKQNLRKPCPICTQTTCTSDECRVICIGSVENVSAIQRPGRPSCFFSNRPEKQNLVEDVEILLPVKFG